MFCAYFQAKCTDCGWNPPIYVLMKNRKANDYFAMWSKLVEIAVSFNCDVPEDVVLYLDFEKAAASAFKTVS